MSIFCWDGSSLGEHPQSVVVQSTVVGKITYWLLEINNERALCSVKKSIGTYMCVVDEMKPLFGLQKLGTHRIKIKKEYVLTREVEGEDGKPVIDPVLSTIPAERVESVRTEVQKILAYRDLLGIASSFERNIVLRDNCPISVREYSTVLDKSNTGILSKRLLDKWFVEREVCEVIKKIAEYRGNPQRCVANLRERMEGVINRVDKEWIWYSGFIVDRLMRRLLEGRELLILPNITPSGKHQ